MLGFEPTSHELQSCALPIELQTRDTDRIRTDINGFADRYLTIRSQCHISTCACNSVRKARNSSTIANIACV